MKLFCYECEYFDCDENSVLEGWCKLKLKKRYRDQLACPAIK